VIRSLYLYVSMNCVLTCLGYCILGARRGGLFLWFPVVDFSHKEVKRAVVVTYRFFSLHSLRCTRLFVPKTNDA